MLAFLILHVEVLRLLSTREQVDDPALDKGGAVISSDMVELFARAGNLPSEDAPLYSRGGRCAAANSDMRCFVRQSACRPLRPDTAPQVVRAQQ